MTIYLDNSATSFPKPASVYERADYILKNIGGSPGRGSHRLSLDASRVIFETRESIARLFNIKDSSRIVFTKSATESINLAFKGLLKAEDKVVTTSIEHNAVAKTLKRLEGQGISILKVPASEEGFVQPTDIEKAITRDTKIVSVVHASNVFGTILPIAEIGAVCKKKGVFCMTDAAQTAGIVEIDVDEMNIDILAGTGHKGLLGLQGTGFLYTREGIEPTALIDGGTGETDDPIEIPDRLEAGTMNTPGIGGLGAGIEFILTEGIDKIKRHEENLVREIINGLQGLKDISIIGTSDVSKRASLVSFNIKGKEPSEVGYILDNEFSIMTRCGTHCAPEAHKTLGTYPKGAIRVSPGYFNAERDIEEFLKAVRKVMKC